MCQFLNSSPMIRLPTLLDDENVEFRPKTQTKKNNLKVLQPSSFRIRIGSPRVFLKSRFASGSRSAGPACTRGRRWKTTRWRVPPRRGKEDSNWQTWFPVFRRQNELRKKLRSCHWGLDGIFSPGHYSCITIDLFSIYILKKGGFIQ